MKNLLSITLLGIVVAAMALSNPPITWSNELLEVGEVKKDEVVNLAFTFENSGTEPIRILSAKGSCGCTQVEFSSEEILPGASTSLHATFVSSKVGQFNKSVEVVTSASPEPTQLKFKGFVVE